MLIDYFLEIFSQTCVQFIPWIPGVFVVYLIIHMISNLFFKD